MSSTTNTTHLSREHAEILGNLDPRNPLSVQALIDFHRATFGGWTMNVESGQGGNGDGGQGSNSQGGQGGGQGGSGQNGGGQSGQGGQSGSGGSGGSDKDDDDEPLGAAGINALKSEREARKGLEKQLADWKAEQKARDDKLAEAFGIKKDAKSDNSDVVAELQKQMAGLQHNNLVLTVAGDHKITDADDIALLRETGSEESMRKLAKRLAAAASSDDSGKGGSGNRSNGKGGTPRPDRSQGNGGNTQKRPGEDGVAEARKRWPKQQNQQ